MIFYQWKCSGFGCTYSETYILSPESVGKVEGRKIRFLKNKLKPALSGQINLLTKDLPNLIPISSVVESGHIGKVVMLR